jgi:hypothetical protein
MLAVKLYDLEQAILLLQAFVSSLLRGLIEIINKTPGTVPGA